MGQQHHNELLDMEGEEKGLTGVGMESLFKGGEEKTLAVVDKESTPTDGADPLLDEEKKAQVEIITLSFPNYPCQCRLTGYRPQLLGCAQN